MIEILKEVTDWGDHTIANGFYHINGQTQLVAYQPPGGDLKVFNKPMKNFSKSRRKFVKVGDYQEKGSLGGIAVKGSNGNTYYVTNGKCSCKGFTFRGDCKHLKEVNVA
jgi:hypothetical protein